MRDLFIVVGFSAAMAVITLSLIPAAIHHAMPKNSPATVLFGSGSIVHVSFRDTNDLSPKLNTIR